MSVSSKRKAMAARKNDQIVLASGGIRRVKMKSGSYGYTSNRGLLKDTTVQRLEKAGLVTLKGNSFKLTPAGQSVAARAKTAGLDESTPSGKVAQKQLAKAVKDSPLKPLTPGKLKADEDRRLTMALLSAQQKVRAAEVKAKARAGFQNDPNAETKRQRGLDRAKPGFKEVMADKRARQAAQSAAKPAASAQKRANSKSKASTPKGAPRKLSTNPKQVARRKARGFPNGK